MVVPETEWGKLYEKVEFASRPLARTWSVSLSETTTIDREAYRNDTDVDAASGEYEQMLREQYAAGHYPRSEGHRKSLRSRFGEGDRSALAEDPHYGAMIDEFIRDDVAEYERGRRAVLADRSFSIEATYVVDTERGIKGERRYLAYYMNGEEEAGFKDRRQLVALNGEYRREYVPTQNAGFVDRGLAERPAALVLELGTPPLVRAGLPSAGVSSVWVLENLTSASVEDTPEGRAYRLCFVDEFAGGAGNVVEAWVLPEKGYRVYRQRDYMHGCLTTEVVFDDYRELAPGAWYPFHQSVVGNMYPRLPDGMAERLASGELSIGSPEVLASQVLTSTNQRERWIRDVAIDIDLEGETFTLEFPQGTLIHDSVLAEGDGNPLLYRVGETVTDSALGVESLLPAYDLQSEAPRRTASPAAEGGTDDRPGAAVPLARAERRQGKVAFAVVLMVLVAVVGSLALVRIGRRGSRRPTA